MSSIIFRYGDNDTVNVDFHHITFRNEANMPYVDTCFIPIEQWETIKNFIEEQIKLKKNEKEKTSRNVIGGR